MTVRRSWTALLAVALVVAAPIAWAEPGGPRATTAPDGSHVVSAERGADGLVELTVYSAAMDRTVPVAVLPAADPDAPAPVLYLLNGVDGGLPDAGDWRAGNNWFTRTDAAALFRDEQVTVVMPIGGQGSFFADWRADDPALGRNRWSTFLTAELAPVIDAAFHGTGIAGLAGPSMAGPAVFRLAAADPARYRAIGAFSGCVRTSDPAGRAMVHTVVSVRHGDAANMWGPPDAPAWADNDAYLHAERLRGVSIYVSTGNGLPGPLDTLDGPGIDDDLYTLADQMVVGGGLDGVAAVCTRQLRDRLTELGIPATFDFRPSGTHSWGYWAEDLRNAWPGMRAALQR
ncbi:alpha/beta hydrolase [Nocardia thailandica]